MISVIIPTLNEGSTIGPLLDQLADQSNISLEVIVVDGGSTDSTKKRVKEAGVKLIQLEAGRGLQMNRGARAAAGEYLLFLHADSKLTNDHQLAQAIKQLTLEPKHVAGHFRLSFETKDQRLKQDLRFFEEKTRLNRPGTWNGDQGLLISTETFRTSGGFWEELPFLEDQDFGRRFNQIGRFVTFSSVLSTSARRFHQEGFSQRMMVNAIIMAMFHLRLDDFFVQAIGIYRSNYTSDHVDPLPFLRLAKRLIFRGRTTTVFRLLYQLGQYAAKNLWQLALARGIKIDRVDRYLQIYDSRLVRLIDHPVGYLVLTFIIIAWIYINIWRLAYLR